MSNVNSRSNYFKRFAKKADAFLDKLTDLKKDTEKRQEEFEFGELKRKKMWEMFKELLKWRFLFKYLSPIVLLGLFGINLIFGFIGLSLMLAIYIIILINIIINKEVRWAMTDVNQPNYFNYTTFSKERKVENEFFREFDDRTIRLEDIAKDFEVFEKKIEEKDKEIKELQEKAREIKPEIKETFSHLVEIINGLNEKITNDNLTLDDLNIVGEYGIYEFDKTENVLIRRGKDKKATRRIDATVKRKGKMNYKKAISKIIDTDLLYYQDENSVAFIFEFEDEKPLVYHLFLDEKTKSVFNEERMSGKLSMEYTRKVLSLLIKKTMKIEK